MKRFIDYFLASWKDDPYRKPLLVRGARQVGKTFSVRKLGESFSEFVEINLEETPEARSVFEKNLDPQRMIAELSIIIKKSIKPGRTLLFIDEIQIVPRAIVALRYFYEKMPDLHVIAAGSLLDFAIEQIGIPVGRVQSLYMFPLSFVEYLVALNHQLLVKEILSTSIYEEISLTVHNKALSLLGDYLALGGMPEVLKVWIETNDPLRCGRIQATIIDNYRQDFEKYAKKSQIKYTESVFKHIPMQLGRKFKYSLVEGEFRKRELSPALDLLVTAGLAHKVFRSAGQGLPLGGQMDPQDYKIVFLDIALSQVVLDLDLAGWFSDPVTEFINKGSIVEAFVGQELLAYDDPYSKKNLYYWQRDARGSEAEIDYLIQQKGNVIPIEVKSGPGTTLKSLQSFLETHPASPYGIRFSTQNFSGYQKIKSFPLYTVLKIMVEKNTSLQRAMEVLLNS